MYETSIDPYRPVLLDDRWRRRSRLAAGVSLGLAALIPACILVALAVDPGAMVPSGAGTLQVVGLALGLALPIGTASFALVQLHGLLEHYARGEVFTYGTFQAMRRFAWASIGATVAHFLSVPLLSVLSTLHLPDGERVGSISVSTSMLLGLLIGFVFLLTASVMAEGRRLADDNASIV